MEFSNAYGTSAVDSEKFWAAFPPQAKAAPASAPTAELGRPDDDLAEPAPDVPPEAAGELTIDQAIATPATEPAAAAEQPPAPAPAPVAQAAPEPPPAPAPPSAVSAQEFTFRMKTQALSGIGRRRQRLGF